MKELRISVRQMVEFTHHGEDIRPGGTLRDMQEGMLGHKARQRWLGEGWTAEKPVLAQVEAPPLLLTVSGRMDAWQEQPPCVEEIKLWQGKEPPAAPLPAHWAQCVCYGAMVCRAELLAETALRVVYVDRQGRERASFTQQMTAADCQAEFDRLAAAYLRGSRCAMTTSAHGTSGCGRCAFPIRPIVRDSGRWRCRSIRPSAAAAGCLPACPRVRANPPRRCSRR